MRAVDRKLVRDLRHHWSQVLSIAALVACGVMSVVSMRGTMDSLERSRDRFYEESRFADVFATVERAPESLADRIARIPGVATVETRVVVDALLDVPGLEQAANGRLVSVPPERGAMLNALHLRSGGWVAPERNEVLVSERFSEANGLVPGDEIGAVINGRWERLRVVGVAISPEFVYEITGTGDVFSDARLFGVLWLSRDVLGRAEDMEGAFNSVALQLQAGAREADVIAELDRLLGPWGGPGAHGRAEQPSERIVAAELAQNRAIGDVIPAIFLGVAAFLLNVVLSRLVSTDREEIAVLKAFGYGNADVGLHYLAFAMAAVAIGTAAGIGGGLWLGRGWTALYTEYFRFPELRFQASWGVVAGSVLVSALAAGAGALIAVRAAVRLPPAEAMRPPSPPRFRPLVLERLGLQAPLSPALRMLLRNLERRPLRSLASIAGVGCAIALLVVGFYTFDAVNYMAELQFRTIQREDIAVTFRRAVPASAERELARLDGVTAIESYRATGVRLRNGHRERRVPLIGTAAGARLHRLVDMRGRIYSVPPDGLVLTRALARALDLAPGDTAIVELIERGGRSVRLPVAGTVDEMLGTSAYLERGRLDRLLDGPSTLSGTYLRVARDAENAVFDRLKELPDVAGATSRTAMLANFEAQISGNLLVSAMIVFLFVGLITVGVIYNGARVALSERGIELASLRVLGFTRREVATLLLGEQGVLTVAAMPAGLTLGFVFTVLMVGMFESEVYRLPLIVRRSSYVWSAVGVLPVALLAALAIRRRLDRMNLVSVLKTRE